jgi:hypothetical protein
MIRALEWAIEDAKRFIARTEGYLDLAKQGMLVEADLKLIRYHSLDVTRGQKMLRDEIEATPDPNETTSVR